MGTYGGLRRPMGTSGDIWVLKGTYIGPYGALWGPVGTYGDI